jgi:hypothetical protein
MRPLCRVGQEFAFAPRASADAGAKLDSFMRHPGVTLNERRDDQPIRR